MNRPEAPAPLAERLRAHRVFAMLGDDAITALAGQWAVECFAAGERIADEAGYGRRLGWVLQGRVRLQAGGGAEAVDIGRDELFGAGAHADLPAGAQAAAATDAEVAFVDAGVIERLREDHPALRWFVGGAATPPVRSDAPMRLLATPVRALLKRPPVALPPTATIADAVRRMQQEGVSSVLLVDGDGRLAGLVTDRDLRDRVLGAGRDATTPLAAIATTALRTASASQPAFDALLLMARHAIHHVPVLDGDRVVGMVTTTDVTEQLGTSPVSLAREVHKQHDVAGLAAVAARVKTLQRQLAAAEASADSTGRIVSAFADALTARLLQIAESRLGPPPVPCAWFAAGSQGRGEQTAKSDQDNGLVLDDAFDEARHGAYFAALAAFVNDGLHACGYVYCPGEMMARNGAWRQPRAHWAELFRRWIDEPEPKALMLTCVFFDQRAVHGDAALLDGLRREVLQRTRGNRLFLAHMVGNALLHRPPLNLFGGIATTRHGGDRDAIDLKHGGIVPIVDLARIYALAGGHDAVNTFDRLAVAAQGGEISEQGARDLRDALEFLAALRVRHQARRLDQGLEADNWLPLGELGNFERRQLRQAFAVVQMLQGVLAQRYAGGAHR